MKHTISRQTTKALISMHKQASKDPSRWQLHGVMLYADESAQKITAYVTDGHALIKAVMVDNGLLEFIGQQKDKKFFYGKNSNEFFKILAKQKDTILVFENPLIDDQEIQYPNCENFIGKENYKTGENKVGLDPDKVILILDAMSGLAEKNSKTIFEIKDKHLPVKITPTILINPVTEAFGLLMPVRI